MPEHNPGQMGGTMRLGKRKTIFRSNNSVMSMYFHQISVGLQASGCYLLFSPQSLMSSNSLFQENCMEMWTTSMKGTDIDLR